MADADTADNITGARCRAADGDGAGSRRAGAVDVPHRAEELDQGRLVAGLGSRHRRQRSARKRLRSATPDYGWLSEESVDDDARLGKPLVWIVDPIDGTRAYLAGREDWCVSVALVADATPVLAAVFAPVTDEFFFAARGQGATLQRAAGSGHRGHRAGFFPHGRSEAAGAAAEPVIRTRSRCFRESVRWRCGCAGSRTAASMPLLRAARAATGTLPRRI